MSKQYVNPDTLFPSEQYGFSQVVVSSVGKIVFVSGQTAWNAGQEMADKASLAWQTAESLRNVQRAVEAAGGDVADIVALRIYIVDYRPEKAGDVRRALLDFFDDGKRPASTWVGISCLAEPEFLIEIEATAVLE